MMNKKRSFHQQLQDKDRDKELSNTIKATIKDAAITDFHILHAKPASPHSCPIARCLWDALTVTIPRRLKHIDVTGYRTLIYYTNHHQNGAVLSVYHDPYLNQTIDKYDATGVFPKHHQLFIDEDDKLCLKEVKDQGEV